ncbi:hypothetical protein A3A01_00730 [Candidatus Nomurabacteria bacterium RIFCSPLOWO2_01_FULL_39_17]|uniref:phenylalanine--tRNA ligase n=1 Tax=Candidatus Nomurabacteria bacterium RIFCSPLOWO2_01_FULL_39_17 TaxID=1801770 RepID=A0A1F6WVI9_9BACT|nr:MAG: hypothetical protein A3A01_00730 [Candidatus Nomurabacteria bacterium RIFCSPLOWO2_01_FULL_39_17]
MKISYNWLKWYVPEAPEAEKLADIFTYHVAEVESLEKLPNGDFVFDIKILPSRAHDLLSHHGVAREIASLLNITYKDPEPMYKVPNPTPTKLKIEIKTDKCRRYMGRIVRNIKVGPSPEWVVKHLESIEQRSINNIVDAANLTMFDCGQPVHCFDLDKIYLRTVLGNSKKDSPLLIIREAKEEEQMTTLDNKEVKLNSSDIVIADPDQVLAIAGVKGGKIAEVDMNTKNIIIEVANFDPTSVRKTAKSVSIFTDAVKRYENDLSPELCSFAMKEMTGLLVDVACPERPEEVKWEEIVDIYPQKQKEKKLSFSFDKISKVLGIPVSVEEIEDILKRYVFKYVYKDGIFEIEVPPMRQDLAIEEDMAEEIGRILGYKKIEPKIPKIDFKPRVSNTYAKIIWAREKLLAEGYSEVMTYTFADKGKVEVMESASDKKFLRTNLSDGLKESLKLNKLNSPLMSMDEIKIFEIGAVFKKDGEEINVAYNEKDKIIEKNLNEFCRDMPSNFKLEPRSYNLKTKFKMWSLFPFIARDVAVWVPEGVTSLEVMKVIKENVGELVIRDPELFDEFKKDGKVSYAFRIVFQSHERTLTDLEVNEVMNKITEKIKENKDWQVR